MKKILLVWFSFLCGLTGGMRAAGLAEGFAAPPDQTKPWCYWYWISDNLSKTGITKDLEAMARVGIGEALIGNIYDPGDAAVGKIKVLTPEWWDVVRHAMREGGRVGVNIGMFNCPGWSQSGGPWIKPEQAMRRVALSETRVTGPVKFAQKLPAPNEPFQDIAVLAFPAPESDADSISTRSPRVTCIPPLGGAEKLADGDLETSLAFPASAGAGKEPFAIEIETGQPFTARSLAVHPAGEAFGADVVLKAVAADGQWQTVRQFKFDRSNMGPGVGSGGDFIRAGDGEEIPAGVREDFRARQGRGAGGNQSVRRGARGVVHREATREDAFAAAAAVGHLPVADAGRAGCRAARRAG
ncbi:MAG: glycosyl hydrolase [Verrucomicrobia bacterium]|nr:glycosyl hydrolase [Verrucomicrobiota bacterium]